MSGEKYKYYQTAAAGLQIQHPVRTARCTSSVRDSNITTCCGQGGWIKTWTRDKTVIYYDQISRHWGRIICRLCLLGKDQERESVAGTALVPQLPSQGRCLQPFGWSSLKTSLPMTAHFTSHPLNFFIFLQKISSRYFCLEEVASYPW